MEGEHIQYKHTHTHTHARALKTWEHGVKEVHHMTSDASISWCCHLQDKNCVKKKMLSGPTGSFWDTPDYN